MRATIQRLAGHAAHHAEQIKISDVPLKGKTWGWNKRINRVPYYQRLFQNHDGYRQWEKTARSRSIIMPVYNAMMWTGFAGTMYMMIRMVLGKKTWY